MKKKKKGFQHFRFFSCDHEVKFVGDKNSGKRSIKIFVVKMTVFQIVIAITFKDIRNWMLPLSTEPIYKNNFLPKMCSCDEHLQWCDAAFFILVIDLSAFGNLFLQRRKPTILRAAEDTKCVNTQMQTNRIPIINFFSFFSF